MHISITAEFAPDISLRPSILRSAEIMASGFFVSSTEPASARYSRLPRQGEPDHDRQNPDHDDDRDSDNNGEPGTTLAVAAARSPPATPHHVPKEKPEYELTEERNHACDHHRDHQHAHVAIADVGEFVPEHGLDFLIVERVDQPACYRNRILLLVEAGREGIERVVVGNAQRRHGDAARDAQVLEEIIKPGLFADGLPVERR